MSDKYHRDDTDEMAELPPELKTLHRRLAADSANWLHTLPSSEGVTNYARVMPQQMMATPNSSPGDTFSPRREVSHDMKGQISMPSPRHRARLFLPVSAAIVIVALLAIAFTQFRTGHTQPGAPIGHTPAVQHDKGWVALPKLDVTTAYDANTPPAIAPTDPNVVYETLSDGRSGNHSTMRRTDDGGATWHTLPTPVPGDHITYMSIGVSPINARTAFLSIIDKEPADCPADLLISNTESNSLECVPNYYSTDAGAHWTLLHFSFKSSGIDHVYGQGNRLFALARCADSTCVQHIVMSVDGGKTWQTVDAALLRGGNNILFFAAAGTSLFAITCVDCGNTQATRSVWQSNDAGAHWARNGTTPTPNVFGITATVDRASGNPLLYTSDPATTSIATDKQGGTYPNFSSLPGDLRVSADGGKTWESAPTQGVPAGLKSGIGVAGPLQDGSVVVLFTPSSAQGDIEGGTLLSWKAGDSAWHQIAPPLTLNIGVLIATPSQATAQGTLWVITENAGDHPGLPTFIFQKFTA
jgi:hypothetical protein